MSVGERQQFVRQKAIEHAPVANEKILWSVHAVKKLRIEGWRKSEIEYSLRDCIIIEDYRELAGRPLPACLAFGYVGHDPVQRWSLWTSNMMES